MKTSFIILPVIIFIPIVFITSSKAYSINLACKLNLVSSSITLVSGTAALFVGLEDPAILKDNL